MEYTVALFGEAGKGEYRTPYHCKTLEQLAHYLGEPPSHDSRGLDFAIQALLYKRGVLYFRVHEEGFSIQDYLSGLNSLETPGVYPDISAICLPGVGNTKILEATTPICSLHRSFLILSERDLYDYLMCQ